MVELMLKKNCKILQIIFIVALMFGCNNQVTEPNNTTPNKMYVYSNYGETFYLVDYKTFEVVKEIKLNVADTTSIQGMTLSTNRDYLIFKAEGLYPSPPLGFALYNIKTDMLENVFFTDYIGGWVYFISAQDNAKPGLIYIHFRDYGTYLYDLFEQKEKEFLDAEHDFTLDKRIYHSPDAKWTVARKNWENTGYTELEFYSANSNMHDLQFVLNKGNKDSLRIYDFKFSKENKLYITFLPGPVRFAKCIFGSYNLETKQLFSSSIKLPWSLSGYNLAYSENRSEAYIVGSSGHFYIIDTETYSPKDTISLPNNGEQSPILISPDENFAFVAYTDSNSLFVIDLNSRKVVKTIIITRPYNMIIP